MSEELKEEKKIEKDIWLIIDENRVANFSDAIFAFAATLLVLKIDLPAVLEGEIATALPTALINLWPQYFANLITFFIIGFYWLNHHTILGLIRKYNKTVVWLNILFLTSISFLPFPVDLYGDHSNVPIVVAFYCASLSVVGFLLLSIWLYVALGHRLIDENIGKKRIRYHTLQYLVAPVVFAAAVPIAFIYPILSQLSWIWVILGFFAVNKLFGYKN